jgi:hypothetical protein
MSGGLDLEQRYRRVLRLLPGYYRDRWEEDMVAAFLDSWLTGDPDEDSVTMEFDRPSRQEVASVIGLAARPYLGGAGAPRRYFAWGRPYGARRSPCCWSTPQPALTGWCPCSCPGATGSSPRRLLPW